MTKLLDGLKAPKCAILLIEHDMDAVFSAGGPHFGTGLWSDRSPVERPEEIRNDPNVRAVPIWGMMA